MTPEVLNLLKEYAEGREKISAWRGWWTAHEAEFATQCDRLTFLRLKHRGLRVVNAILAEHGVTKEFRSNTCHNCGETIFVAKPGRTIVEEIRAFAERSSLRNRETILRDGWIHPGQFCPHGCTEVLHHYRSDSWESINREYDATHRSTLVVLGDGSLLGGMAEYKVYVNGNIHGAGNRLTDQAPENSVYTRLQAGVYRIVLRDYEVRKPDRRESNSLEITLREDERCVLRAALANDQLLLAFDTSASPR